jgi:hypothetical protein
VKIEPPHFVLKWTISKFFAKTTKSKSFRNPIKLSQDQIKGSIKNTPKKAEPKNQKKFRTKTKGSFSNQELDNTGYDSVVNKPNPVHFGFHLGKRAARLGFQVLGV